MRPIIARETSLSAMCGRLRVGKDFVHAGRLRSNDEWSPVCYGALDPPVGGLFFWRFQSCPLSQKPVQKWFCPIKGVAFVRKTFLQKNFLVPAEIPLAARAQTSMKRTSDRLDFVGRENILLGICQLRRRRCFAVQAPWL